MTGNQHTGTEVALATAGSTELISLDGLHVRLGSWRGSDHIGYLAPLGDARRRAVEAGLTRLRERGFSRVVTSAIAEPELSAFSGLGFDEHERLHLLAHDLASVEPPPWRATRRARPQDREAVLNIDHAAFQPFWQLDSEGLADAISATPTTRYRVTVQGGAPTGYAVFGLAGDRGYLQRLAVHPAHAGQGLASVLIRDGLRWLQRRGASRAFVNTQVTNDRAVRVYQQHGFVLQSYQLVVLTAPLHGAGTASGPYPSGPFPSGPFPSGPFPSGPFPAGQLHSASADFAPPHLAPPACGS